MMSTKTQATKPKIRFKFKGEPVASGEQTKRLLRRLARSGNLVTLELPELQRPYTSMIIETMPDSQHLVLDQLNSLAAHRHFLNHQACRVLAHLEGCTLEFCARLLEFKTLGGHGQYQVTLDSAIYSLQRRDAYRASTFGSQTPNVFIHSPHQGDFQAYLIDLSMEGMGLRTERNQMWPFMRGDEISDCRIEHKLIQTTANVEIRHVQKFSSLQYYKVGARFSGLSVECQRLIREAVMSLQIKQIQR